MTNVLTFILESSICFTVIYSLFLFFFRDLTFHKTNRFILLSIIPISFIIPSIQHFIPIELNSLSFNLPNFNTFINDTFPVTPRHIKSPNSINQFTLLHFFIIVYLIGFTIKYITLLISIFNTLKLKYKSINIYLEDFRYIQADVSSIFSSFNWIFIPKDIQFDDAIIEHEKAHVSLKHFIDLLAVEIYVTVFWFNPLVYTYRKSLKSVHEFQADNLSIDNHKNKEDYLKLLLKNISPYQPQQLSNHFNQLIIKKRIDMITKNKSKRIKSFRYLLLLPILALLLMAFTKTTYKRGFIRTLETTSTHKSTLPSIFPIKGLSIKDITSHFGENRTVSSKPHGGIDIKAAIGTAIIATADGIVSNANLKDNWGNLIVISHADGYETWYAHLNDFIVENGQKVSKGETIGHTGNTGKSTGPHLHYEIRKDSIRIDPLSLLNQ